MNWTIFAFEPNSINRKTLIDRFESLKNIVIDSRAVAEKESKNKPFYISDESTGISGLLSFRETHKVFDEVDVTTVSNIVDENNIKHIDFLKIDVEGYDFSVLKGVPWEKIKPDVIECEFEDAKTKLLGHSWRDICEYLVDKGYIIYVSEWHPIVRYGIRHDWLGIKKYPCELEDENAWGNLLAFSVDPGESEINDAVQAVIDVKNPNHTISVEDKKTALANNQVQAVSSKKNKPKQFKRGIYVRFAIWARDNNQTIFRLGQLSVWYLRYMKRHPMLSMFLIVICTTLILLPNITPEFFPYRLYLYSASSVIIALFLITTGTAFLNRRLLEFVAREDRLRSGIKRQIDSLNKSLNEKLSQVQATIDEQVQTQTQQSVAMGERLEAQSQQQDELDAAISELRSEDEKLSQVQATIDEQVQTQTQQSVAMGERLEAQSQQQDELDAAISELRSEDEKLSQVQATIDEQVQTQTQQSVAMGERLEAQSQQQDELDAAISELRSEDEKLSQVQATIDEQVQTQTQQSVAMGERLEAQSQQQDELDAAISELRSEDEKLSQVQATIDEQVQTQTQQSVAMGERLEAQSQQQDELDAAISELRSEDEKLSQVQATIDEQVQTQTQQSVAMGERLEAQSQQQDELDAAISELRSEDEKLSQVQATQDNFISSSPLKNFSGYQSFNRQLSDTHIEIFQKKWGRILGIDLKPRLLSYLAHRIFTIEGYSRGRLATTTEDVLLRTLVTGSVRGDSLRVLEIGTLFGIGLSVIYDYTKPRYESVHLTAIDPLNGYYGKDVNDIVTGEPISEATVNSNLAKVGAQQGDYTLIKNMSTDDVAIDSIRGELHDVLIIDGDHSYSGVKADFINYMSIIKRGGYIIFDDYGVSDWPDVKRFVDEVVMVNPNLALVGIEWRTAVFKVVKRPKPDTKKRSKKMVNLIKREE